MCIFLSFISFQQQNCEQVVESVSCTLLLKGKKVLAIWLFLIKIAKLSRHIELSGWWSSKIFTVVIRIITRCWCAQTVACLAPSGVMSCWHNLVNYHLQIQDPRCGDICSASSHHALVRYQLGTPDWETKVLLQTHWKQNSCLRPS